MSAPQWREGVGNSVNKRGQDEGGGVAVSGHPFQCGLGKRERGHSKVILSSSSCVKD